MLRRYPKTDGWKWDTPSSLSKWQRKSKKTAFHSPAIWNVVEDEWGFLNESQSSYSVPNGIGCRLWYLCEVHGPYLGVGMISLRQ